MGSLLSLSFALPLLFFLNLNVSANLVFEEGYTVSTVLDGNKLNLNPHSILPHFASSDLIILDSEHSAFFTVSSTASQETGVKWLSGKGFGFSDGDLTASMFNKPKNFAVDLNGNVYVADKGNLAIRKISKSGVTTIAGGSKTPGHVDGPGRNASFSADFELAFIPERCALMICDHGHKLVRQINLKSEDCARSSHPDLPLHWQIQECTQLHFGALRLALTFYGRKGFPIGTQLVSSPSKDSEELSSSTWPWALAVGVSCLLGLIMGFAVRPYITSNEGFNPLRFNATWKRYLINQGRQILMFCFDIRNAIVSSLLYTFLKRFTTLSLSQLSLVFSINSVESQVSRRKSATSLDSKHLGRKEATKSRMFSEQLRDLISFDEVVDIPEESADNVFEQGAYNGNRNDVLCEGRQRVDNMICANILGFEMQGKGPPVEEPLVSSLGLVKRR